MCSGELPVFGPFRIQGSSGWCCPTDPWMPFNFSAYISHTHHHSLNKLSQVFPRRPDEVNLIVRSRPCWVAFAPLPHALVANMSLDMASSSVLLSYLRGYVQKSRIPRPFGIRGYPDQKKRRGVPGNQVPTIQPARV